MVIFDLQEIFDKELSVVDPDIADIFRKHGPEQYRFGHAVEMQISRYLKKISEQLESINKKTD